MRDLSSKIMIQYLTWLNQMMMLAPTKTHFATAAKKTINLTKMPSTVSSVHLLFASNVGTKHVFFQKARTCLAVNAAKYAIENFSLRTF